MRSLSQCEIWALYFETVSVSAISPLVCDTLTSPSGKYIRTNSGIYTDTLADELGCDSIITVNLTVHHSTFDSIAETVCDSFTAPDGAVYTTSGIKTAVIPNSAGCDSIITLDLTIKNSSSFPLTETVCNSYTAPDGMVYTTSGTKTAIIPIAVGCDSIIAIELTG